MGGSIFTLLASASIGLAQGPLAPPGPPGPTMKTLDQLEPRIPISSLPFTISVPGSYYLTRNLQFSAATGNAILIVVSNVTLDLMGFTLSSTAGVTGNAIDTGGGPRNIEVRNGVIAGNTTVTVSGTAPNQTWNTTPAGFNIGIDVGSTNCQFSHLRISGCRTTGLNAGDGAAIDHVTASSNGGTGISADGGSVTNSSARSNGGRGISVANGSLTSSTANFNGGDGVYATSGNVTSSTASSNGGRGIAVFAGSVTSSTASSNGAEGISAITGVVAFCKAINNGGENIDAALATRTGNNPTP